VEGFDDIARLDNRALLIVTAPGRPPAGCLVGFGTQASIDPPRMLVCLSVMNATARAAHAARVLAVHAVPASRLDLARLFGEETADDGVDKFARCAWSPGPEDVPLLDDCPTKFVGLIHARFGLGDHDGLLLTPISGHAGPDGDVIRLRDAAGFHAGHPA
jgi:flavin reductase (DIM6/NTAB) family NADH-FMN oxidoreductase RutF